MAARHQAFLAMSPASGAIGLALVLATFLYARGRHRLPPSNAIPAWRAASFLSGVFLVWVALASPLVAYQHDLLTIHMIQHLLLMTVAPPLILLGEPLFAWRLGLPRTGRVVLGWLMQRAFVRRSTQMLSRPALCWTVSTLTLVAWHVPALLTLALHSEVWHAVEQSSFLVAGVFFWYPVVQPWPSRSAGPQWSTLLYLFLATLPCDILSGFLVFSERVAYPAYASMPRHFGLSVIEDQQFAAALMWTSVTLVYLVAAAILSTGLLSTRDSHSGGRVRSAMRGDGVPRPDSPGLEAV
jgi:cytochrome c oxidase assembly factor CtaG